MLHCGSPGEYCGIVGAHVSEYCCIVGAQVSEYCCIVGAQVSEYCGIVGAHVSTVALWQLRCVSIMQHLHQFKANLLQADGCFGWGIRTLINL